MIPSLRQLKYLVSVAEHRHFSKAAEACFVTQSTLSTAIRELEQQLGVVIFERNRKSVLITPVGEKLLDQARAILGEVEDFVSLARAEKGSLSGEIRLGVIPTIGPFLLPRMLGELRQAYGKLRLYLKEEISSRLAVMLKQGKLDVLVLAFPYPLRDMETVTLFEDEFLLCMPSGHALEKQQSVRQKQLRGESLLLLEEGHCLRDHALEACELQSAETNLVYQGTSLHTLVQMVAGGLGLTLLPAMAVAGDVLGDTGLPLRRFSSEKVSRRIGMAWRKSDPRRDEYRILAEFITKRCSPSAASDAACK
ncbi:MAG: hydrogen peroxide-inducible genes activator [Gammaproteobacteria bacterium]|nr:hydrogen peroxide-inducible genes activator [Gammaproteobacteria bacterium]MXY89857.1 hydrogen peroxide-inducible genes activator [Gammaproteobacteria bacterium]MXZ33106.1 hydrogen peroxide-inducible genes activator [Gammaproteobacteria bacterium]MYA35278.1 hydrogen peroxide-inducible genes activator [Gammaproteobacteria bacterium]MYC58898.1 hydrogen peroxide-inducible genes activator [Gammaproteobacteria bacterium]